MISSITFNPPLSKYDKSETGEETSHCFSWERLPFKTVVLNQLKKILNARTIYEFWNEISNLVSTGVVIKLFLYKSCYQLRLITTIKYTIMLYQKPIHLQRIGD